MNLSKKYDTLIKESVGNEHTLSDCPYYDERYFAELKKEIEKRNLLEAFGALEFKEMSNGGIKICSVASSSRIGFLYGVQCGIKGYEKTDVRNGICRPHYDNFDAATNTFYEYKCHEFTTDSQQHNCFPNNPEGYKAVLSRHFLMNAEDVDCKDLFGTFGMEPCLFFDFKQFLCHVLGILSVASREVPANLQYVMFVPKKSVLDNPENKEIAEWLGMLEMRIRHIFEVMGEKQVRTCQGECGSLREFIKMSFRYQDVSEIEDIVYNKLK